MKNYSAVGARIHFERRKNDLQKVTLVICVYIAKPFVRGLGNATNQYKLLQ